MKEEMHKKCLLLLLLLMNHFHLGSRCMKTWKKNNKWDKHSEPKQKHSNNTGPSTDQTASRLYTLCSFSSYYCSPVQQEELWITKSMKPLTKQEAKNTHPSKTLEKSDDKFSQDFSVTSYFRNVTKRFHFFSNTICDLKETTRFWCYLK